MNNHFAIAASDICDISCFIPAIEFGYGGFKGSAHSKQLQIIDENRVYIETSFLLLDILNDLLKEDIYLKIKKNFKQRFNIDDYINYLNKK